ALALRQMEGAGNVNDPPTKISQLVPEVGITIGRRPSEKPKSDVPRVDSSRKSDKAPAERSGPPPSGAGNAPAVAPSPPVDVAPGIPGFSVSELWPESERDRVRQAEAMLGARDAVNAILACDVLVTRVLASAAGLVGTLDAPRDPALVSLLLGLDGPRYLRFRTLVRAARHREAVTMRDGLECSTFGVEPRRSRETLRR